ncbi:MAG: hypothetical protein GXP49_04375 [Deltaproteobacteria bacterium]|nr:hypothetical protein [Deltaproteobacteria bacterium]
MKRFTPRPIFLTLLISTILVPSLSMAKDKPRLLLLDVTPKGVPAEIASSLTDLLDMELERGGLFQVMSEEDFRSLLKAEEYKQLTGTEQGEGSDANMARIAKGLNAPFLLRSSLGKVGRAYLLSLDLLDAEKSKVVRRVNQTLVGDPTGLVGSVRSAVIALTLEEKGVAPDISEKLIDDLKISEKEKTLFLSISPLFALPVGPPRDEASIAYFMPQMYGARIQAEMPFWHWLRAFAGITFASTINAQLAMQDKHIGLVYNPASNSGADPDLTKELVATTLIDYSAMRLPIMVGIKAAPESGRFLPYGLFGLGISFNRYSFSSEDLWLKKEPQQDGTCEEPYSSSSDFLPGSKTRKLCELRVKSPPSGSDSIQYFGLEVVAGGGIEWLLTHHIGLKIDARYTLGYAFESKDSLNIIFKSNKIKYQTQDKSIQFLDTYPVRKLSHNVAISTGLVVYW